MIDTLLRHMIKKCKFIGGKYTCTYTYICRFWPLYDWAVFIMYTKWSLRL